MKIDIETTDFKAEYNRWKTAKKNYTIPASFIHHAFGYICKHLKPVKYTEAFCAEKGVEYDENLKGMIATKSTLDSLQGTKLKDLIYFLAEVDRGAFVKNMVENPRYGSLTPIPLLAMKEEYGINYMDWTCGPSLKVFLGKFLVDLADEKADLLFSRIKAVENNGLIKEFDWRGFPNQEELVEYRNTMLFNKTSNQLMPLTSNKKALTLSMFTGNYTKEQWSSGDKFDFQEVDESSEVGSDDSYLIKPQPICRITIPAINYMLMQTWLANASIRVPDVMILDPYNWDRVPEPYDVIKAEESFGGVFDTIEL